MSILINILLESMPNHPSNLSSDPTSAGQAFDYVSIIRNPDGTITRVQQFPIIPATPDPNSSTCPVLSKDVSLNPHHNTWVRLFLPREALDHSSSSSSSSTTKLPLVVYFHGGGFTTCSASTNAFHNFCVDMVIETGVVIVSVDYRLAPEHRLPAAYDDAMEALHWIKTSDDEWLREFTDFSSCFLMGVSAGGNIAYHAALRAAAAAASADLEPLKIKGLILHHPYFGGSQRTKSEMRLVNDRIIPLFMNDLMWECSLPVGADRDHKYSNPTVSNESVERVRLLGWKVMVTGCEGDPLIDRQMEVAKMLKEKGVQVMAQFNAGGCHTVEFLDPTKAKAYHVILKQFVYPSVSRL
ncbi:unnamed protein product [Camellia sinensis]